MKNDVQWSCRKAVRLNFHTFGVCLWCVGKPSREQKLRIKAYKKMTNEVTISSIVRRLRVLDAAVRETRDYAEVEELRRKNEFMAYEDFDTTYEKKAELELKKATQKQQEENFELSVANVSENADGRIEVKKVGNKKKQSDFYVSNPTNRHGQMTQDTATGQVSVKGKPLGKFGKLGGVTRKKADSDLNVFKHNVDPKNKRKTNVTAVEESQPIDFDPIGSEGKYERDILSPNERRITQSGRDDILIDASASYRDSDSSDFYNDYRQLQNKQA